MKRTVSVSVVIPCYNCAGTLRRTLISVIEQTYLPEKIILVNDASTDTTKLVIDSFQAEFGKDWIVLIDLKHNQGPAHARNQGIKRVISNYIAFLDADDTWHHRKLEIQYTWMQSHPEAVLSGHKVMLATDFTATELKSTDIGATKISKWNALLSNPFSTPSVMMKSGLSYFFDDGQHFAEDYLLWLSVCLNRQNIYRIETSLAYIHKAAYGEGGLSQSLLKMEKGELQTYRKIYQRNHINLLQYSGLVVFSLMKFVRRVLLSGLSRKLM